MKTWKEVLIRRETPILEAIEVIDKSALQIALVINNEGILLGTVTDGDIRRGILRGLSLYASVDNIMNGKPVAALENESVDSILATMRITQIQQIPIVNTQGQVVGLEAMSHLMRDRERDNIVVLMAGGMGSRLRPLTQECPKPLLKVGYKPILETILENFIDYGFRKFYISVNYLADKIMENFGDGSRWGVQIDYLMEDNQLGTAGALSLLPEIPESPLLVMNGDLLTKVNFHHLLNFHKEQKAQATMCVREYDMQVPYGVVRIENNQLLNIDEKPIQKFFINAGIYVFQPAVLQLLKTEEYCDMPTLFEKLIETRQETVAFPIREYWMDIGQMSDFEKANVEFGEVFR